MILPKSLCMVERICRASGNIEDLFDEVLYAVLDRSRDQACMKAFRNEFGSNFVREPNGNN